MGPVLAIAASAGGLAPLKEILRTLRPGRSESVFVVMHIGAAPSNLADLLSETCDVPVAFAHDAEPIMSGRVYVAPPDHHMVLRGDAIELNQEPMQNGTRPAGDPTFVSAAEAYGANAIGIVLSGEGTDGAVGLRAIQLHGGTSIVQSPREARVPSMPLASSRAGGPRQLTTQEIVEFLRIALA